MAQLRVRTFMDTETHAMRESHDILDAVQRLIGEGVTGAPVVDDQGQLTGMLSEQHCLRLLTTGTEGSAEAPSGTVAHYMLREFRSVSPDMDIYYVAGLFLADPTNRRFPVVDGGRLVGVITIKDVLRAVQPHVAHLTAAD